MSDQPESMLSAINGGGKPNKFAELVRSMKAEMPVLLEHQSIMAQLQRAKFEASVKAGFTEAQALELCKAVF